MARQIHSATLEQIARKTLATIGVKKDVSVSWKDEDKHYTDGQSYIVLSRHWFGKDISLRSKENMKILTGIIQHEVIHWLQDIPQIEATRRMTGLGKTASNIVDDAQGERLIWHILGKKSLKCLIAVRRLIKKNTIEDVISGITGAPDLSDALDIMFFARFRTITNPFMFRPKNTKTLVASAKSQRGLQLVAYIKNRLPLDPKCLPQFEEDLAKDFPELCKPDDPNKNQPCVMPSSSSSGFTPEQRSKAQATAYGRSRVYYISQTRSPALPGATALAAKLRMKLDRAPAVKTINAVGDIDRRALARGNPIPFRYAIGTDKEIGRSVVICVDHSGSMFGGISGSPKTKKLRGEDTYIRIEKGPHDSSSDDISKALIVAQATALAVKAEGGRVIGVVFGDYALMNSGPDKEAILFPSHSHEIMGNGTSFLWLNWIWNEYPEHKIIVVTDGAGEVPAQVDEKHRARTTVINIAGQTNPEMDKIAANVIVLSEIKDLPLHMINAVN